MVVNFAKLNQVFLDEWTIHVVFYNLELDASIFQLEMNKKDWIGIQSFQSNIVNCSEVRDGIRSWLKI